MCIRDRGFSLEVPAPGAVLYTGSIEGSDGLLRPAEYPGDSGAAPGGVTSVWNRELPLDEAISLIGVLDRRQEELRDVYKRQLMRIAEGRKMLTP